MRSLLIIIGFITMATGLLQILAPDYILGYIGGDIVASNQFSFGIIGMFMLLFGGLCIHTLYDNDTSRTALIWCAVQKLCAGLAIALAVSKGLFNNVALLIAVFDIVTSLLFYNFIKNNALR